MLFNAAAAASAIVSVSVMVLAPSSQPARWTADSSATLGSAILQWSAKAGAPPPNIDSRVANYPVGGVKISAPDLCSAVSVLLGAMKYAQPAPDLSACAENAPVRIAIREEPASEAALGQ